MNAPRLAIIRDLAEEKWPAMDLCGEMLLASLKSGLADRVQPFQIQPAMVRRFGRLPLFGGKRLAINADRLLNRFWDYPRHLRRQLGEFDFFHLIDHSYAQLIHVLPGERTGVYCHDLDAFQCLFESQREPRPRWFRMMARRILRGLQTAALVFYSTAAVRRQIELYGILSSERLVHAPYGVALEFSAAPEANDLDSLPNLETAPFLLHVGTCRPRKRIDVLLEVFAQLRTKWKDLQLVKVGGDWTATHRDLIERLKIAPAMRHFQGVDRRTIAALYRHAAVVLLPSEAEGFGLPVIEGLACGSIVVASEIPALCEVGGNAIVTCPVGDVPRWVETIDRLLSNPGLAPDRETRLAQAGRYSWAAQARTIVEAYLRLVR